MNNSLNIVTYNIHHGSKAKPILENVCSLARRGVKVFCLQEVRKYAGKKFLLDTLLPALGPNWRAECLIKPESNDLGLCILWDSKILQTVSFQSLLLPKLSKLYLYERAFEKIMRGDTCPLQRGALIANFTLGGQSLRVINVHLDWHGGVKQRGLQLKFLGSHLELMPQADYEVLCGDFNTIGYYRFHKIRHKGFKKLVGEKFENSHHKKPTTSHLQSLDHIFVKNLNLIRTEVLKYKGSDHFPILAEIRI